MRALLFLICFFWYAVALSQNLNLTSNGFEINGKEVSANSTLDDLQQILGKPESTSKGDMHIDWKYPSKGILVWFDATEKTFRGITLEFLPSTKGFKSFNGTVKALDISITKTSTRQNLQKIKDVKIVEDKPTWFCGDIGDWRISVNFAKMKTCYKITVVVPPSTEIEDY